ncbi:MAG TPA: GNAT family N-acetyltransferase [Pseudolabrys sp.]|nr:GNAT family N-acetyltransferase [Pseudolabrys sp.]
MNIRYCKMTRRTSADAQALLQKFLREDEHYLDSSAAYGDKGPKALERAVDLFLRKPEIGFVWLAYADGKAAGVCIVCYAISTSVGGVVAKLDDVFVADGYRGKGVGTKMIAALKKELKKRKVGRIDTAVHKRNPGAARYYARLGFRPLGEERLALVL